MPADDWRGFQEKDLHVVTISVESGCWFGVVGNVGCPPVCQRVVKPNDTGSGLDDQPLDWLSGG